MQSARAIALFRGATVCRFCRRSAADRERQDPEYELRERGVTASTWDREAAGYELKRGVK